MFSNILDLLEFAISGWIGATGMFGLFFVSSIINKLLMSPVVKITVKKERMEGNLRYKHVFVRVNAESLAFCGSKAEQIELDDLNTKLRELCKAQQSLMTRQLFLDIATSSFDYLTSIATYIFLAFPIFAGNYDDMTSDERSKFILNTCFVLMYLASQLSNFVDMAITVSKMAGVVHRTAEIFESDHVDHQSTATVHEPEQQLLMKVDSLNVVTPDGSKILVSNLTFDLLRRQSLLISGRSSSGKTSILRVIKGLWPAHQNHMDHNPITMMTDEEFYYVPQRSFLSETGLSIREVLSYPETPSNSFTETQWMIEYLQKFGLSSLLDRVGGSVDAHPVDINPTFHWSEDLSPGEMQLLAFIRMFYHSPTIAILDEATSALSTDVEQMLYSECIERNMTFISVAHRESVRKFHQRNLVLSTDDQWEMLEINDY